VKDPLEIIVQQMIDRGMRYDVASQEFEKKFIVRMLERSKGNQSRAARLLGMHRNTLSRKIAEYQLELPLGHNGSAKAAGHALSAHGAGGVIRRAS
jgi:DNA-binding NtrC family response regulator